MAELFREPVTRIERELIDKLSAAKFLSASWPKRFVRDVYGLKEVTPRQRYWIARLSIMYRRQIAFSPDEFLWCVEMGKYTQQELDRMKLAPRIEMPSLFEALP